MHRYLTPLPFVFLAAMAAAPLAAQQSADTPAQTEDATPLAGTGTSESDASTDGAVPALGDGLSLGNEPGTETDGEPEVGQTYVKEVIEDWELQCIKTDEGDDPCQMYQLLRDAEGNAVSEVSIFRLPDGNKATAGATIIVPLETLLTAQMTVAVDGGKGKRYPFSFCNPVGCYARVGLTEGDVTAFKRGGSAKVSVVPFAAPDQKVEVEMSLSGFTDTYDKVTIVEN